MKEVDMVKVRGIIGIVMFLITIVFVKYSTAFNLFPDGASELISYSIGGIIMFSLFLANEYISRLITGKKD